MVGWEHDGKKQTGCSLMFNMILQDGIRSDNAMISIIGKAFDRYDYFLPQKNKITAVTIYYDWVISGFRFHLSDGSEWRIGQVRVGLRFITKTVDIADNEVIVGFQSNSHPDCQALYVEWQLITARQLRFD